MNKNSINFRRLNYHRRRLKFTVCEVRAPLMLLFGRGDFRLDGPYVSLLTKPNLRLLSEGPTISNKSKNPRTGRALSIHRWREGRGEGREG